MKLEETRKKVLFLITKSNWGGAQRYVYDLATHLDQTKFEAVVALGGDGELVTMLKHAGVRVIKIKSLERNISLKKEYESMLELYKIVQAEKPDILHLNSSKAGGVGTAVGRVLRVPRIIFTAHGWAFNEDRPLWQRIIIKFLHWITVLLSHRTIAVSKAVVRDMNWPWTKQKMKVLHPGRTIGVMYEHDDARTKIVYFCPSLELYKNDPWLITIAELHPVKNIDVLIRSMRNLSQHPSLRLVIIGEGQERNKLQTIINTHNLTKKVFLLGALSEAARFLKAADIFISTSRSEAYGYVVHEAGLAHLPVIATRVGGIPEIIEDRVSGILIPPNDTRAIGTAVDLLMKDDTLKNNLASKHNERMTANSLEKMVSGTETLYTL
jgi:glycosyltransferase involved in cell wall biosynthesis